MQRISQGRVPGVTGLAQNGDERESGFTLIELMVVMLVIGILVSIAAPVYLNAAANAEARSCQANQTVISNSVEVALAMRVDTSTVGAGDAVLDAGSGWGNVLLPEYIKTAPRCPTSHELYNMSPEGVILGDQGAGSQTFVNQGASNDHQLQ